MPRKATTVLLMASLIFWIHLPGPSEAYSALMFQQDVADSPLFEHELDAAIKALESPPVPMAPAETKSRCSDDRPGVIAQFTIVGCYTPTMDYTCAGCTMPTTDYTCAGCTTPTMEYTCSGGTCSATCAGTSTCDLTCPGTTCPTMSGSPTCPGTGTCYATCPGNTTCDHTCPGTSCPTMSGSSTCAGTSTCSGTATCVGSATCEGASTCAGSSTCEGSPTCVGSATCDQCAVDTVMTTGSVSFNGTPLCALVLANGQYMFSCKENLGQFQLQTPLSAEGDITLFVFADGFSPYKQILQPEDAANCGVVMDVAVPEDPTIDVTWSLGPGVVKTQWVRISGSISWNDIPLCAMVLANGQHMFSCNQNVGEFVLEVPLDQDGKVTLFVFADGFAPYKLVLTVGDA